MNKPKTSKSDGIYIGLSGQTKRTWALLHNKPIGKLFAAFGKMLYDYYKDAKDVNVLAKQLTKEIDSHGHSGCSILVELQQLCDLLGARCLDDDTRNYLNDMKEID